MKMNYWCYVPIVVATLGLCIGTARAQEEVQEMARRTLRAPRAGKNLTALSLRHAVCAIKGWGNGSLSRWQNGAAVSILAPASSVIRVMGEIR